MVSHNLTLFLSFLQSGDISVFETNIRYVGGLLSTYALTGDDLFRKKAHHVAEKLIPAFQTPTGIPYALVNIENGVRYFQIFKKAYKASNMFKIVLTHFRLQKTMVGQVVIPFYQNLVLCIWNLPTCLTLQENLFSRL